MAKRYEEIIETRYCNLRNQHVTHFVKNQIFQPVGNMPAVKAPIQITCTNRQPTTCSDCELMIGRTGKKHYE